MLNGNHGGKLHKMGLCRFWDCWFCDIEDMAYFGEVKFDDQTMQGFLTIALDPTDSLSNIAIQNRLRFYIDQDIDNGSSILHRRQYNFNANIGSYGGYKIPLTVTQIP
jgi:hypothetical protein